MEVLAQIFAGLGFLHIQFGQVVMILVGLLLIFLAIRYRFEPLLLLPIGFGGILANIPGAGLASGDGILHLLNEVGIETGVFPLVIFLGVGALTDFSPMLANPRTLFLGAAAQFGIFFALIGALGLSALGWLDFSLADAAAIGIIGGADGPTAIYVAGLLAPELLGPIAVAAYSYMALVPLIQPPVIRALTSVEERAIRMEQLRSVSRLERIAFPLVLLLLTAFLLPGAAALIGMFCLGNLLRECGVTERLADAARGPIINTVTLFLGLAVGSKLSAEVFLTLQTVSILLLGVVSFVVGTASGVLMAKAFNLFTEKKINPLIGAAGVSAVPMAARVAHRMGQEADPHNFLLMHAMGPNVAGVVGSATVAGVLLQLVR